MPITLYIAEKPSLGRTIAAALGGGRNEKGIIRGRDWAVTWCIGHLYEQAMPEDYDPALKQWRRDALPILPDPWKLKPRPACREQIAIIKKLLGEAQSIVHCGDPDREGQLLVDEVLERHRWRGPVSRAWLPDLSDGALRKALARVKDNGEYQGLSHAALGRSRADWLVGMNLSRAMTLANRQAGGDALISIGRVQTPTLKLVVERDRQIEAFEPRDFFPLIARFDQQGSEYEGRWQPGKTRLEGKGFDEEGRCIDRAIPDQLARQLPGQPAEIRRIEARSKSEPPPLPFSLNELQQAASKRFGLSAQRTLEIAQALYERHKLITYPRTDCRYLSKEQHQETPAILAAVAANGYQQLAADADPGKMGRAFNDKRITAHTAIIPTANRKGGLNRDEANVYDMITRTWLAQFYPDHRYKATTVETICLDELFISKGRQVLEEGWKRLFPPARKKPDEEADDSSPLPALQQGPAQCIAARVEAKRTKPPAHYTEGTLIKAMANVARFVEDEKLRKILRENQGIGTEATRAGIIETLKERRFLESKGKNLLSTQLGRQVIDQIPEQLGNPAITAWWEQQLAEVEKCAIPLQDFERRAITWLTRLLQAVDPGRIRTPMRDTGGGKRGRGKSGGKGYVKGKGGKGRPTPKMIAYAERLAQQKGEKPPRGYKSNFDTCKRYLDEASGPSNKSEPT
jgi:DNA topoisomerase-3